MALGTLGVLGLATAGGAVAQGLAAKSAADSQADAAREATDAQLQINRENNELNAPLIGARDNALAALLFEAGIGPQPSTTNALSITENVDPGGTELQPVYYGGGGAEGELRGYEQAAVPGGTTTYSVGDRQFDTRAAAQDYIDSVPGQFDYTPIDRPDPNLDLSASAFEASPGYQFRLDEGNKALERAASARGLRLSGGALKDAMRFGQGMASDEYGAFVGRQTDQFNRSYGVATDRENALRSLAGLGQQGAQAQIASNTNYANAASQNALNLGAAQAQGAIGIGNAFTGGVNNLAGLYGQAQSGYFGQNPGFGITPVANPFGA